MVVINNEGDFLYYKKAQNAEWEVKKVFDFSEMGDGNYKVCVCFDDIIIYRELIVNRNKIRIGDEVKTHKPVFQYSDEMLTVTCLNPAREKVSLQIYRNGEYFYQHNVGKDLAMHKTFDISGLRNGNYIFVIKDNNGRYEYELQMGYYYNTHSSKFYSCLSKIPLALQHIMYIRNRINVIIKQYSSELISSNEKS